MKPTFNQLKVFAAVAHAQSMTGAAKALHMTQPGVSIQIKQLETHYGLALIEVIGKKVFLTDAGRELYDVQKNIAQQLAAVDMSFAKRRGHLKGELRLAVVSTAKYFIPHLLEEFHRQFPDIDIRLTVANRATVLERLERNEDDLVILSQLPTHLAIVSHAICEDKLVMVAHPQHPLVGQKNIAWKDLTEERFIFREQGSGTRIVMEKLFIKHQLKPKTVMELGSSEAIKQALMAGFGLSLLSEMSLTHELILKKLAILDIQDLPVTHPWYAVYLKGKSFSPILSQFLACLNG